MSKWHEVIEPGKERMQAVPLPFPVTWLRKQPPRLTSTFVLVLVWELSRLSSEESLAFLGYAGKSWGPVSAWFVSASALSLGLSLLPPRSLLLCHRRSCPEIWLLFPPSSPLASLHLVMTPRALWLILSWVWVSPSSQKDATWPSVPWRDFPYCSTYHCP